MKEERNWRWGRVNHNKGKKRETRKGERKKNEGRGKVR